MGKKDKNKKKGKGAEKTASKTEKKLSNKQKKELAALGEVSVLKSLLCYNVSQSLTTCLGEHRKHYSSD